MPENNETLNPDNFDLIDKLKKQFGSLSKIPDEELGNINYERTEYGVRPIPKEGYGPDGLESYSSLTDKIENSPFDHFEINVETVDSDTHIKGLGYQETERFFSILTYEDSERADGIFGKTTNENLINLDKKIQDQPLFKEFPEIRNLMKLFLNPVHKGCEINKYEYFDTLDNWELYVEVDANGEPYYEGNISHEVVAGKGQPGLIDDIERDKGYFSDLEERRRIFHESLDQNIYSYECEDDGLSHIKDRTSQEIKEILHSNPELSNILSKNNIVKGIDLIKFVFSDYLRNVGLSEASSVIENSDTADALLDGVKGLNPIDPELIAEEKSLRIQIKNSDRSDVTNLKILNDLLKGIEETKSDRRTAVDFVREYLSVPETLCEDSLKRLKKAQKMIVRKKNEYDASLSLYFDGKLNPDYDLDPGIVSGDCTVGNSLPFLNPKVPVFNIKIFENYGSSNQEHVGNVYLVKTKDPSGMKIWHLEAIQFPNFFINWDDFSVKFIDGMSQVAQEKGIDAITINEDRYLVSNYDYIGKAFGDFLENDNDKIKIKVPKIGRFQSTGKAFIVWGNEKADAAIEYEVKKHFEELDELEGIEKEYEEII